MRLPIALLALLAVAASLGNGGLFASAAKDHVKQLTSKSFEKVISSSPWVLVLTCMLKNKECEALAPEYFKAAANLHAFDPSIVLAEVDADEEPALVKQMEVVEAPSFRWFKDGKPSVTPTMFMNTSTHIEKWVKRRVGPFAVTVNTVEELKALEGSNHVLMVAYFKAVETPQYQTFHAASKDLDDVQFAMTTSAEVAKAAGLTEEGYAAITTFDDNREIVTFSGDRDSAAQLKKFFIGEKLPLSLYYTPGNHHAIYKSGIDKQIFLVSELSDIVPTSKTLGTFRSAAKQFRGDAVFVSVEAESEEAKPLMSYFGKSGFEEPMLFAMDVDTKFLYAGPITKKAVIDFARSVVDGTAPRYYRSEAMPDDAFEKGVAVVVGKTFERIVLDPTKDVLLVVISETCSHCKALAPTIEKLASRFSRIKSVTIAKMNGQLNEHPLLEIRGFPSLFFFPAKDKSRAIPYDQGEKPRTLANLHKFIKEHASIPYTLPKKEDKEEL